MGINSKWNLMIEILLWQSKQPKAGLYNKNNPFNMDVWFVEVTSPRQTMLTWTSSSLWNRSVRTIHFFTHTRTHTHTHAETTKSFNSKHKNLPDKVSLVTYLLGRRTVGESQAGWSVLDSSWEKFLLYKKNHKQRQAADRQTLSDTHNIIKPWLQPI